MPGMHGRVGDSLKLSRLLWKVLPCFSHTGK